MSRDADPKATRLFDKRTVDRNIKKGLVTRKDYEKHLKTLDDVAGKGLYGGAQEDDEADERDEPEEPAPAAQ
ncbi:MAG TPA: hypothetical protein VN853_01510 [Polyangia bacterium]|jgi:hypothetical protein|nr:hypothetical protein [Polyangia bacterium]